MYLNIVNNLSFNQKRNKEAFNKKETNDSVDEEASLLRNYVDYKDLYNSIFYGQLTKNWLTITN